MSKTRVIVAAAVVTALLTLTGCEGILYTKYHDEQRDGGVTPQAAEELVLSIDGISNADFSTHLWSQNGEGGLGASEGMNVILNVTVDAEHSIADPRQFLAFLAATAWSVNDHYPDGDVFIMINGGISALFDWQGAAAEVFDNPEISYVDIYPEYGGVEEAIGAGVPIAVSSSQYGRTFGRWPSEPVAVPSGLLLNEPVTMTTVPAIADPSLYEIAMGGECLRVVFTRVTGDPGIYSGTVRVELLDADGVPISAMAVSGVEDNADFCFDTGTRPVDTSATLESEALIGFDVVRMTVAAN